MKRGYSDRFGTVRTINKTIDGIQQSRDFMTMTNSEVQFGTDRNTESAITPAEPESDYEETSRHRGKTRVMTSTGSAGVIPDSVFLSVPNCTSELVMVMKSLDFCVPSIVLFFCSDFTKPIRIASLHVCGCFVFMYRTVQTYLRDPKSSFSSLSSSSFWMSTSSLVSVILVNGKKILKMFLTFSENEEDVAVFSVTPCMILLSVGDPAVTAFSFEISGQFRHLLSI